MLNPGDESKPFAPRFRLILRALLVETSVKTVGFVACDFGGNYDGSGVRPSVARMCRDTGLCKNTVVKAWKHLGALGLAGRVDESHWNGRFKTANEYQLAIPETWHLHAMYGPHFQPFRCIDCRTTYDPPACAHLGTGQSDGIRWTLQDAVFCSPRCRHRWTSKHGAWSRVAQDNDRAWKLFAQARDDEW